jgi:hypothetical protein
MKEDKTYNRTIDDVVKGIRKQLGCDERAVFFT